MECESSSSSSGDDGDLLAFGTPHGTSRDQNLVNPGTGSHLDSSNDFFMPGDMSESEMDSIIDAAAVPVAVPSVSDSAPGPVSIFDHDDDDGDEGGSASFFDAVPSPQAPGSDEGQESQESSMPSMLPLRKRPRGRPPGTKGTRILRHVRQRVAEAHMPNQEASLHPQPGSVEHARACKQLKHEQKNSFSLTVFDGGVLPKPGDAASSATSSVLLLDPKSEIWKTMACIGSPLSRMVALAAQHALSTIEAGFSVDKLDSITDPVLPIVFEPNRHHVTDSQLAESGSSCCFGQCFRSLGFIV